MKGVILAGGLGTRLYPLTYVTNKHLLPVYDQPMIFYPINTLVQAGIRDILVVTGGPHVGHFLGVLRNGKELGLSHIEYAYQENHEKGISAALAHAEGFADGGSICVILGDNCTDADIKREIENFNGGGHLFFKEVEDPERFGVPTFDESENVISIDEKPQHPQSSFAVTGLYIYDETVFDKIRTLEPSGRGELEITDVNKFYLKEKRLTWSILNGFWRDAGTFETLREVSNYWGDKRMGKER